MVRKFFVTRMDKEWIKNCNICEQEQNEHHERHNLHICPTCRK